jgi:hypothetical protein
VSDVFGQGPSPLDKAKADDTLSDFDRRVFESLKKSLWIPNEHKEYMVQYFSLNQPLIPVGQIPGIYRNVARVYKRAVGVVEVVSSTTETAILSEQIPGDVLGVDGALRFQIACDWLLNIGASDKTITWKVKYGGTTIYHDSDVQANYTNRMVVTLDGVIINAAATNSQFFKGWYAVTNATTAPTVGQGPIGIAASRNTPISSNGYVAIDTTQTQPLEVTVQLATSSANNSFRRQHYTLEIL